MLKVLTAAAAFVLERRRGLWNAHQLAKPSGEQPGDRKIVRAVALGAAVLVMATSASAQPRATAYLQPVEGGRWEASSLLSEVRERICLEESAYVLAGRVEPGYSASWILTREGAYRATVGNFVGENDGRRWSWAVFMPAENGQCFDVRAVVTEGPQEGRQSRQTALRLQIYQLRVGVDW